MPTALVRDTWSKGWTPGSDINGGDPNGLIRMDNCKLDSFGSLTLEKGIINVEGPYPGFPHSIYSHTFNGSKFRFVGLSTGSVLVNGSAIIDTSGNPARARFSGALGNVFVASGTQKKKFEYGAGIFNWGVETPKEAPTVSVNNQEFIEVVGGWFGWEGLNFVATANGGQSDPDASTFRVVMAINYNADFMAFPNGGTGLDDDILSFIIRIGETNSLIKVRVEFGLSGSSVDNMNQYYWAEWDHDINQQAFVEGVNAYSKLEVKRKDFVRAGDDTTLSWSNVAVIRVTFLFSDTASLNNVAENFKWSGGSKGPLNGTNVQYVQVNARHNGTYVARSAVGPETPELNLINASTVIAPADSSDPQINRIYLYRRGGASSTGGLQFRGAGLEYFHQIFEINLETGIALGADGEEYPYSGSVTDTIQDGAAQDLGILANLNTRSVADIDDEFISIIDGMYSDRMIIATFKDILLSEEGNPDAVDDRYSLRLSGDMNERIFWVQKIAAQVFLAGTERNIYEVSGNLAQLPDGTINVNIRPLGEAHPPISFDTALDSGIIFYMANDGWRMTNGGNSQLVSGSIGTLFKGNHRYGIDPVNIYPSGAVAYPCAVYKGQLYTSNPLRDGSRPLFIHDLVQQYWRLHHTNPISLCIEEDGTLLGGYGNPGDFYLKQLDIGTVIQGGEPEHGQKIYIQTTLDDNMMPRNRKDAYTLRLLMDTGGTNVDVFLAVDNETYVKMGTVNSTYTYEFFFDTFDTFTQKYYLGFKYSVLISGNNLQRFKLTKITIEYDPHPELITALRIPNSNLGSYARKRITNYAFMIDTLGHTAKFQMIVDNAVFGDQDEITFNGKKTFIKYFTSECIGTDFGGILQINATNPEGAFEFYGLNLEEITSEKLPTPVKYLVIPADNYGTPNRKRHSSYKFEINTRGSDVRFTPQIDGTSYASKTFNTSRKQTVEYFFSVDTIGIDIGGILESTNDTPFEFYGVIKPQDVEVLPPRLTEFRIPDTDYGTPDRKRHSSYKFQINTNGVPVSFTPILDGVRLASQNFTTSERKTVEYFFNVDTISIDIGGELNSTTTTPFEFYKVIVPQQIEVLPPRLTFFLIPPNDYGVPNRKRHSSYKFNINTNGQFVKFTPIIDLVPKAPLIFSTPSKQTVEYFFYEDTIGKDIGGKLEAQSATPFEFYGVVIPQNVEELPPRLTFFLIPPNDYGVPNRKRHSSYKFQINTNSYDVRFTPIIDMVRKTPMVFKTDSKDIVEYYFYDDTIGKDIGGELLSLSTEPFEFYGVVIPQTVEKLPDRLKFFLIPPNDYGTPNRKRHSSYKFIINTNGKDVRFTPILDLVEKEPLVINTPSKRTVEYFFTFVDTISIDIGGKLEALEDVPFEFYGVVVPQDVETLPPRLEYFRIPCTNYGQPGRKRHSSYKFQINTNGANVRFTPELDLVDRAPAIFNTPSRELVEYFFLDDTKGIDIGGRLEALDGIPFEFYGVVVPEKIEMLPPRLKEFRIPENNYGVAAPKRIRTMPMEIDTYGHDVTFIPIVDNVQYPSTTLNSPVRKTLFHFFDFDIFGTDYSGELKGNNPFEFYYLLKPEEVEVLPVAKVFDQIGPIHLSRIGKIIGFRIRIITREASLPWIIYGEDDVIAMGTLTTLPLKDVVYEQEWISKGRNATITRIEFGPPPGRSPFHRYYVDLKYNLGGHQSDIKWERVTDTGRK